MKAIKNECDSLTEVSELTAVYKKIFELNKFNLRKA